MGYLGNAPALAYTSFAKQDFTVTATTSYSLDHPVANENEIALFINFVRQEPTTSYSASGSTLTLTEATSSSDDMYAIFLGKAIQTVNPPNASVGTSQLVDASITSGKLASGVLPTNTPAFSVKLSANQSISDNVLTRVAFDTENFDTNNAFDTSTYLFTVPTGKAGKYSFTYLTFADDLDANDYVISYLEKNGTIIGHSINQFTSSLSTQNIPNQNTTVEDCAEGDEIEVVVKITGAGTQVLRSANTIFTGYKIIE